ncbi:hypothetical protein ADICYQ_1547 [Cyclobacterium qasimii M12-11B]|uniref:Uncharacterized protein n=1 Tax=Cyclobacterium qasimii M12-11B TaxID=641524 RepID=S7VGT6_9BACT|nr:hypothetical protein ADICYQ_1547 [Cyclobacterium qasimii M12-11B]
MSFHSALAKILRKIESLLIMVSLWLGLQNNLMTSSGETLG